MARVGKSKTYLFGGLQSSHLRWTSQGVYSGLGVRKNKVACQLGLKTYQFCELTATSQTSNPNITACYEGNPVQPTETKDKTKGKNWGELLSPRDLKCGFRRFRFIWLLRVTFISMWLNCRICVLGHRWCLETEGIEELKTVWTQVSLPSLHFC